MAGIPEELRFTRLKATLAQQGFSGSTEYRPAGIFDLAESFLTPNKSVRSWRATTVAGFSATWASPIKPCHNILQATFTCYTHLAQKKQASCSTQN